MDFLDSLISSLIEVLVEALSLLLFDLLGLTA